VNQREAMQNKHKPGPEKTFTKASPVSPSKLDLHKGNRTIVLNQGQIWKLRQMCNASNI